MGIPILQVPRFTVRREGPFSRNADPSKLRLVLDLPPVLRQPDDSIVSMENLGRPDPARFLWSLGQRSDIELFWLAEPDEHGPGAVHPQDPDLAENFLPFTTESEHGATLRAVWPYQQWARAVDHHIADLSQRGTRLRELLVCRIAVELDADILVTSNPRLLQNPEPSEVDANPVSVEQGLALVGLYLRGRQQYPVVAPAALSFGEYLLRWSAVRAQLPAGWGWGNALVEHGHATSTRSPILLFGSAHERLVRALRYRDQLHQALLDWRQDNSTADEATEALDNLLVNLVATFDIAARVAHLVAGFDPQKRHLAGWQRKDWRKQIAAIAPQLAALFVADGPGDILFEVCRLLRNTVHGEALQGIGSQTGGGPRRTLVALPEDDAADLRRLFGNLGGSAEWGVSARGVGDLIEPRMFVERLLPAALSLLNEVFRLTPVNRLAGVTSDPSQAQPPEDASFGLGTRVRTSLLFGLQPLDP